MPVSVRCGWDQHVLKARSASLPRSCPACPVPYPGTLRLPLPLPLYRHAIYVLAPAPAPSQLRPSSHDARSERPVGYLRCEQRAPSRRHLQQRAATGRQLLRSLAMADLDAPPTSPYTCQFAGGGCPYIGPMAGVECSSESDAWDQWSRGRLFASGIAHCHTPRCRYIWPQGHCLVGTSNT